MEYLTVVMIAGLLTQAPAQFKPALPRVTFEAAEVGPILFRFPAPERREGVTTGDFRSEFAMMMNGHLVYTGQGNRHVWIWSMENPREPKLVSRIEPGQNVHAMSVFENRLLINSRQYDMTDPVQPQVLGSIPTSESFQYLQYPYVYAIYSYGGPRPLSIVDISNPSSPRLVKEVDVNSQTGFPLGTVHVIGNLLILTGGEKGTGVSTWDLSDPLDPRLISATPNSTGMYFSYLQAGKIYTTGPVEDGQVTVFDYKDPSNLKEIFREQMRPQFMGDYAHFQNGYMFGGAHVDGERRWAKFDVETMQRVALGDITHKRYVIPMGNMIWSGHQLGRACLGVHQARPDSIGPRVTYVHPADGAVSQALTSRIGLNFDEDIDNRSINEDNIFLVNSKGGTVPVWRSYTLLTVNLTPKEALLPNTTYQVVVREGGVVDYTGNPAKETFLSRFSTGPTLEAVSIRPIARFGGHLQGIAGGRLSLSPHGKTLTWQAGPDGESRDMRGRLQALPLLP